MELYKKVINHSLEVNKKLLEKSKYMSENKELSPRESRRASSDVVTFEYAIYILEGLLADIKLSEGE